MPRAARNAPGGIVYHVLNRANGRLKIFKKDQDFIAFENVLKLAFERVPIRILDWCIMSSRPLGDPAWTQRVARSLNLGEAEKVTSTFFDVFSRRGKPTK